MPPRSPITPAFSRRIGQTFYPYELETTPICNSGVVRAALTPFWFGAFASVFAAAWAIRVRFRRATGFDIELVLSRTLLYGALTACVVSGYFTVFAGVERLIGTRGISGVVAAAAVALAFQPLRSVLQRRVERLVYGDRSDPYAALARLGEQLQVAPVPDMVLTTIVDGVTNALRLGYCAVSLRRGDRLELAVERGRARREHMVELPLLHQGEPIGALLVEPAPKSTLSANDSRLLRVSRVKPASRSTGCA